MLKTSITAPGSSKDIVPQQSSSNLVEDSHAGGRAKRKSALNFMKRMKRFAAHGSYSDDENDSHFNAIDVEKELNRHSKQKRVSSPKVAAKKQKTDAVADNDDNACDEDDKCSICDVLPEKPPVKKYGTPCCKSCCSFLMRVEREPAITSAFDIRFTCIAYFGEIGKCGTFIPPEWHEARFPIQGRCKACWIAKFLEHCVLMDFSIKQRIVKFLPKEMHLPTMRTLSAQEIEGQLENIAYKIKEINSQPAPKGKKKPLVLIKKGSVWSRQLIHKFKEVEEQEMDEDYEE